MRSRSSGLPGAIGRVERTPSVSWSAITIALFFLPTSMLWAAAGLAASLSEADFSCKQCTDCHGTAGVNPAPPQDTSGNSAPTARGVGAHQSHLGTNFWHREGICTDCHAIPATPPDHLELFNTILSGVETFAACSSIALGGEFTFSPDLVVEQDARITLHAGTEVRLHDGVEVESGAELTALIAPLPSLVEHVDGNGNADLTWGVAATADGAAPSWNGTTCSGTYCHGSTLSDGGFTPDWTDVGGGEADCGTCHGTPPGLASHVTRTDCSRCHGDVISAEGTFVDPAKHIDGTVDVVTLTCSTCHGTDGVSYAPPVDAAGNATTTAPGVGAHQSHLGSSTWHREGVCTDCHTVPVAMMHADGTTDLAWGVVATADGATPAYNGTSCAGSYCHGSTLSDGGFTPTWIDLDGSEDACGTCHGTPPTGRTHAGIVSSCEECHAAVIESYVQANPASTLWNDPSLHINGIIESNEPPE